MARVVSYPNSEFMDQVLGCDLQWLISGSLNLADRLSALLGGQEKSHPSGGERRREREERHRGEFVF